MKKPILVLRPEPGNSATCARARALDLRPIAMPLFTIEAVAWNAPDPKGYTAVLMTSANAARFAGLQLAQYAHLPLFAVGEATERAAHQAGFASVVAGDRNVANLLATIATLGSQKILHLCGADPVAAPSPGLEIDQRIVYRSLEIRQDLGISLTGSARPICLIHSPRAGAYFAEACDEQGVAKSAISIVAISEAAARAVGPGWEKVAIAADPRDDALLKTALELA